MTDPTALKVRLARAIAELIDAARDVQNETDVGTSRADLDAAERRYREAEERVAQLLDLIDDRETSDR